MRFRVEASVMAAALLVALGFGPTAAGERFSPGRGEIGFGVPAGDGGRLGAGGDEQLMPGRRIRAPSGLAAARAERAREAAEAERREWKRLEITRPPAPGLPRVLSGDRVEDRLRAERDAAVARRRAAEDRTGGVLQRGRRLDAAEMRSDLAAARAARERRLSGATDRLHRGAAAERQMLGQEIRRPGAPLIRAPRLDMD